MRYISDIPEGDLRGKHVIVRAGLDVPLDSDGNVADRYRVKRSAETLRYLSERGARTIVLSHIGRDPHETNEPVARALKEFVPLTYIPDLLGLAATQARDAMQGGEILLLENLRSDEREAANDPHFAKLLARLGDLYVDDAFSVAHRAHASIVGIPAYLPSYGGLLMKSEIEALKSARSPAHPSFAILGGAKFETKEPLIELLLGAYDHLFIAGALANDVLKAQGFPTGVSLLSEKAPSERVLQHPHLIAPVDVTVERADKQVCTKKPSDVASDEKIVDVGPDSIAAIAPHILSAKFVLWNGPTGLYEGGFTAYTQQVAGLIKSSAARAVIGGGDTIAAIEAGGITFDEQVFLSTGGGAMLEYLLRGTLPGILALG